MVRSEVWCPFRHWHLRLHRNNVCECDTSVCKLHTCLSVAGEVTELDICVECSVGTYSFDSGVPCQSCPEGAACYGAGSAGFLSTFLRVFPDMADSDGDSCTPCQSSPDGAACHGVATLSAPISRGTSVFAQLRGPAFHRRPLFAAVTAAEHMLGFWLQGAQPWCRRRGTGTRPPTPRRSKSAPAARPASESGSHPRFLHRSHMTHAAETMTPECCVPWHSRCCDLLLHFLTMPPRWRRLCTDTDAMLYRSMRRGGQHPASTTSCHLIESYLVLAATMAGPRT